MQDQTIHLTLPVSFFRHFTALLGGGVHLKIPIPLSVQAFLEDHLELDEDYIKTRIQTVFVNGKVVDVFEQTFLSDGQVIALSAAMPGLAGAVFRKSGNLARMRSEISHKNRADAFQKQNGAVTLKLFNLILKEIGPRLLAKGLAVPLDALNACIAALPEHEKHRFAAIATGLQASPRKLGPVAPDKAHVRIAVYWAPHESL